MSTKWVALSDSERKIIQHAMAEISYTPERALLSRKLEKLEKRITVSSAKGKGRNLQQWVCRKISDITGIPYTQADDDSLIRSREMGQPGVDIILRGDAQKAFPFSVECKSTESLNLLETINQGQQNQKDKTDWLVVHKRKALPEPIVLLSWEAFERIIRERGAK